MTLTQEEMDQKIDEHFGFEARDDVEGVLTTLAPDVTHDIVGFPTGPTHGRENARSFYETLFADLEEGKVTCTRRLYGDNFLAAIIHKFGVSVDFLRKFRAESVFRCDYKASKLVEPNRDEARAPSGNSSARRGLYICVGAGSQGTVRWDTDGASVMQRAFVRDKTMPGAPRCDEKFPEPGHRF